jgi:4-hydroxythreonine-4-phosphate dehydrogenase
MGDPAGIGPEITRAAWARLRRSGPAFYVIGDPSLYGDDAIAIERAEDAVDAFARGLPVRALSLAEPAIPSHPSQNNATSVLASIEIALESAHRGEASAVVTNPIAKSVLHRAGFTAPGHTEHIAAWLGARVPGSSDLRPVMMLVGGGLRVALATIHLPLKDVFAALSVESLVATARVVDAALRRDFGVATPRIAFAGLNPHAGESGDLGSEEIELVNPAAKILRDEHGLDVSDARSADALFAPHERSSYDAVVAMYHDQGLIPVKTLDFDGGVNVTLGLPIVRTSPDHGTAFDIAGKGQARPDSLIAALVLAGAIAARRARLAA